MSKSVNIDEITDLEIGELNKVDLYSQIKHRVEQENHWQWQKWFWIGTVILGVAAQIALVYLAHIK